MAKRERNLALLADLLIARHIRISVPDGAVRNLLAEVRPEARYQAELVERDMHCIAVVGAGASAPLLARGDDLAKSLEEQFERDEGELDRLKLVNNLKRNALETRLIALSRSPDAARRVRDTISKNYDIRHPTLLTYELLAHLLKHRFLDAIISFNFDELLDQSLDDELDRSEYTRVVSERDCSEIQANPSAADYVPLYVKLHGTASEPDSLRFTPDSYYSIPERVSRVVEELLHTDHCVIANIGSGLSSFDFQRLLRIPDDLDVFNLGRKRVDPRVSDKIARERNISAKERRLAGERKPDERYEWLHECNAWKYKCDGLMEELTASLDRAAAASELPVQPAPDPRGCLVQFRAVRRHEAIAQLLGSDTVHSDWAKTPEWVDRDLEEYARRRTILELAFAGAKARGLLSLVPLVQDRPARYYELYRRRRGREASADDWTDLCSAAGLEESNDVPDILISRQSLRATRDPNEPKREPLEERQRKPETHALHEFDPERLARHVLLSVKYDSDAPEVDVLTDTLRGLQTDSEVELHMRDDRVCSKAFKRPATLSTATASVPTPGRSSGTCVRRTMCTSAPRPATGCWKSPCARCFHSRRRLGFCSPSTSSSNP